MPYGCDTKNFTVCDFPWLFSLTGPLCQHCCLPITGFYLYFKLLLAPSEDQCKSNIPYVHMDFNMYFISSPYNCSLFYACHTVFFSALSIFFQRVASGAIRSKLCFLHWCLILYCVLKKMCLGKTKTAK